MNNWYIKNLLSGLKLALFMRCERKDFSVSWHAFITIALTFILAQFTIETALYGNGKYELEYYDYWSEYHASLAALILLASYIICASLNRTDKILDIVILFYNAFFALFIPYCLLHAISPDWLSGINKNIENLILIWTFLIMFRIIYMVFNCELKPQILSALVGVVAIYTLNSYVYLGEFYDTYTASPKDTSPYAKLTDEEVFEKQNTLLAQALARIKPSKKGTTDIYGVSFASYGYQDVFMRESKYVAKRIGETLKAENTITLINNKETFFDTPMADATNLRKTLKNISKKMQPDEDILLLYLTSHGTDTGLLAEINNGHSMRDINAALLAKILKESGIKNKIIIISACDSGAMIDALKDDNTLIITDAAKDNDSYGTDKEDDIGYFAEGYFKQALSKTTQLDKAFTIAKKYVFQKETTHKKEKHSKPQIYIGKNVRKILAGYRKVDLIGAHPSSARQDIKN